ncbi:hypothetical protein [Hallella colorans]|nr:hypothetical protein [Hallella colorans]
MRCTLPLMGIHLCPKYEMTSWRGLPFPLVTRLLEIGIKRKA